MNHQSDSPYDCPECNMFRCVDNSGECICCGHVLSDWPPPEGLPDEQNSDQSGDDAVKSSVVPEPPCVITETRQGSAHPECCNRPMASRKQEAWIDDFALTGEPCEIGETGKTSECLVMMWTCLKCNRTTGATEIDAWVTDYLLNANPIIWRLAKALKQ